MTTTDSSRIHRPALYCRRKATVLSLPVLLTLLCIVAPSFSTASSSTVYFRKRTLGNIFAVDSRSPQEEQELEGTVTAPRFVALARSLTRLYWSDARSIQSAVIGDGSDARTDIGSLARVRWFGVQFGSQQTDLLELSIQQTPCVSISHWSPTFVECLVALPAVDDAVEESDCVIRTNRGEMRGVARNNYEEMRASGLPSPIVERLEIQQSHVAPSAMAIDTESDALFWSNVEDGTLYQSSLRDTSIRIVQKNTWDVKGLVLLASRTGSSGGSSGSLDLVFSLEGKGIVRRAQIFVGSLDHPEAETLLSGLRSPRGLAIDPAQRFLYWTEKTGRIYRVPLSGLTSLASGTSDTGSTLLPPPQLLLTLPTHTRLDGLAVDDSFVYWCETNSNVVARAPVDMFQREVLVGGSADSALSWPRSIVLQDSKDGTDQRFYFTEYTGRISTGKPTPTPSSARPR